MVTNLRARLSRSHLSGFLVAASAVLLIGLLLGLPALANTGQPFPPSGRGDGSESMGERYQEFIDLTPVKLPEESLGALTPPPCDLHA